MVAALVLGWLSGGSLNRLQQAPAFSHPFAILLLFVLQGIVRGRLGTEEWLGWGLLLWAFLTTGLIVVIALTMPELGMRVVAVGIGLNVLVVLANGFMPVALPTSSVSATGAPVLGFYGVAGTDVVLAWLGDVLPLPLPSATYALSAGDVLLMVGVMCLVLKLMTEGPQGRGASSR
jgi:hypothetical protein